MTRRIFTLTWKPYDDAIFGKAYQLAGLRDGESAVARRSGDGRGYISHAWVGGHYMMHLAGTMDAAMTRLNKELDRRSIGLFDEHDIRIKKEERP